MGEFPQDEVLKIDEFLDVLVAYISSLCEDISMKHQIYNYLDRNRLSLNLGCSHLRSGAEIQSSVRNIVENFIMATTYKFVYENKLIYYTTNSFDFVFQLVF